MSPLESTGKVKKEGSLKLTEWVPEATGKIQQMIVESS